MRPNFSLRRIKNFGHILRTFSLTSQIFGLSIFENFRKLALQIFRIIRHFCDWSASDGTRLRKSFFHAQISENYQKNGKNENFGKIFFHIILIFLTNRNIIKFCFRVENLIDNIEHRIGESRNFVDVC